MARKMIVANWKMNFAPRAGAKYAERLEGKVGADTKVTVVLCPPSISLYSVRKALSGKHIVVGAQNISDADNGPHTGEISATMLKGIAKYSIIGHSERRATGEHDKLIAKKVAAALRNDIIPVLCVGETLEDRHHSLSTKVVIDQLTADLHELTAADVAKVVITYEPVWAISNGNGHGEFATPDAVAPMVSAIRSCIEDLYGEEGGAGIQVLYGGSVNPDNTTSFLAVDGIDGLLVGGASLVEAEFLKIIKLAEQAA